MSREVVVEKDGDSILSRLHNHIIHIAAYDTFWNMPIYRNYYLFWMFLLYFTHMVCSFSTKVKYSLS